MNRYEVSVLVTFRLDAEDHDAAWETVEQNGRYVIEPYDDNTVVTNVQVVRVFDTADLEDDGKDQTRII